MVFRKSKEVIDHEDVFGSIKTFRVYPRVKGELSIGLTIMGVPSFVFRAVKHGEEVAYYMKTVKTERLLAEFEVQDVDELPKIPPEEFGWKAVLYFTGKDLVMPATYTAMEDIFNYMSEDIVINIVGVKDDSIRKRIRKRVYKLKGHKDVWEDMVDVLRDVLKEFLPGGSEQPKRPVEDEKRKQIILEELRALESRAVQPVIYGVKFEIYIRGHDKRAKKILKEFAEFVASHISPEPKIKIEKVKKDPDENLYKIGKKLSVAYDELVEFLKVPQLSSSMAVGAFIPSTAMDVDLEHEVHLGYRIGGKKEPYTLTLNDFKRHVYIIGTTGAGKTNTMEVLVHELRKKYGDKVSLWVIDPHGDLAIDVLMQSGDPENTYIFDPLRVGFQINPLEIKDPAIFGGRDWAIAHITSELMSIYTNVFQLNLAQASNVKLLLEVGMTYLYETYGDNPTLPQLLEFYLKLAAQEIELEDIKDDTLRRMIMLVMRMPDQSFISTVSRLFSFAQVPSLREFFNGNSVDFLKLIEPGTLVIWRLPKTELPEKIQSLLMSVIVMRLWFTIKERYKRTINLLDNPDVEDFDIQSKLNPVILFVDEFQNLGELGVIQTILTEARKFGFHLVLAHQNLSQLDDRLLDTVLANTNVQIVMKVETNDAKRLAGNLDWLYQEELLTLLPNLPTGQAVIKKMSAGEKHNPPQLVQIKLAPDWKSDPQVRKEKLKFYREMIAKMKEKFGVEEIRAMAQSTAIETYFNINPTQINYTLHYIYFGLAKAMPDVFNVNDTENAPSPSKLAKVLGKRRQKIVGMLNELEVDGYIKTIPSKDGLGEIVLPTEKGLKEAFGDLSRSATSAEAVWLLKRAIKYYAETSEEPLFMIVPKYGKVRPDLIIIPMEQFEVEKKGGKKEKKWRLKFKEAQAVEVETTDEITKRPDNLKENLTKDTVDMFKYVNVWVSKEVLPQTLKIISEVPIAYRQKTKVFAVNPQNNEVELASD